MGISVYYSANRSYRLTEGESTEVEAIITKYNDEFEYADIAESFSLYHYDKDEPEVIISGATKLPASMDVEELMYALEHWLQCLTEIRLTVTDAEWHLHLDDNDVVWVDDKWQME